MPFIGEGDAGLGSGRDEECMLKKERDRVTISF